MRVIATVLACVACTLIFAGSGGAVQRYPDTAGDAGAGPDIRSVAIGNDATGRITLRVRTAQPLAAAHTLKLFVDVDKRASTGHPARGFEVVFFVSPARGFVSVDRWNGSELVDALPRTFRVVGRGRDVELSINRTDLGNTRGFRFLVISTDAGDRTLFDSVPEKGMATYDLWACSNGVDDDRDGKRDFPADQGCSRANDDDESI